MNPEMTVGSPVTRQNLTEQALMDDIEYLEKHVRELQRSTDPEDQAMLRTYTRLLASRRQMLSAWRDGRPEAWRQYRPALL